MASATPTIHPASSPLTMLDLLTRIERQEERIRSLQNQQLMGYKLQETLNRHEDQLTQHQTQIGKLQSASRSLASPTFQPATPVISAGVAPNNSFGNPQSGLNDQLAAKDTEIAQLTAQLEEQQESVAILTKAYAAQSKELDSTQMQLGKVRSEMQTLRTDYTQLLAKQSDATQSQVLSIRPIHESLEQQIDRMDQTTSEPNSRTAVQLIIKTLAGKVILVSADLSDHISVVKTKIMRATDIPHPKQTLLNESGKELDDNKTLLELGLFNQAVIRLILNNRAL